MDKTKEEKPRKRVVVEEVAPAETPEVKPQIDEQAATTEAPETLEAPKEEVEEAKHHENEAERIPEKFAPKVPEKPSSGRKYILLIIPLLLILATLGGGIYVFTKGVATPSEEATPEPTIEEQSPSPTPAATPSKEDLAKFTIAIQNGSGIAGEATKAQKILTDTGFKVSSIGNAKTYDYTGTIIEAKKSVDQAYLDQLSATLGKTYEMGKATTLADSEKTDVVVIVGKTKI